MLALASFCAAGLLLSSAKADQLNSGYGGMLAPGIQLVDRNGKVVGNLLGPGQVIRKINGAWVEFTGVVRDGLIPTQPDNVFYTTSNCSGIVYLDARTVPMPGFLIGPAGSEYVAGKTATIYYPAPPYRTLPLSSRIVQAPTTKCEKISPPLMIDVGVAKTTSLTVAPPLSVR